MSNNQGRVAVVDYGMGNLHSVAKALEHVAPGAQVQVTSDAESIVSADRVIFPGVGAIRDCMGEIRRLGFDQVIAEVSQTKPLLAICVGMQALMTFSDENNGVPCLDIMPGHVRFFGEPLQNADGSKLKVPHMGWNEIQQSIEHPLWAGILNGSRFYFVHSYYVQADDAAMVAGTAAYGVPFTAALAKDNIFAVQCHPEKSHNDGLKLLENFMHWDGAA